MVKSITHMQLDPRPRREKEWDRTLKKKDSTNIS